jgi:hypothetical protein
MGGGEVGRGRTMVGGCVGGRCNVVYVVWKEVSLVCGGLDAHVKTDVECLVGKGCGSRTAG